MLFLFCALFLVLMLLSPSQLLGVFLYCQGVYGDYPGPHCVVEGGVERIAEAVATPEVRPHLGGSSTRDRIFMTCLQNVSG